MAAIAMIRHGRERRRWRAGLAHEEPAGRSIDSSTISRLRSRQTRPGTPRRHARSRHAVRPGGAGHSGARGRPCVPPVPPPGRAHASRRRSSYRQFRLIPDRYCKLHAASHSPLFSTASASSGSCALSEPIACQRTSRARRTFEDYSCNALPVAQRALCGLFWNLARNSPISCQTSVPPGTTKLGRSAERTRQIYDWDRALLERSARAGRYWIKLGLLESPYTRSVPRIPAGAGRWSPTAAGQNRRRANRPASSVTAG
jgi:hypothetical protein